jgi:hypothetical protein
MEKLLLLGVQGNYFPAGFGQSPRFCLCFSSLCIQKRGGLGACKASQGLAFDLYVKGLAFDLYVKGLAFDLYVKGLAFDLYVKGLAFDFCATYK